MESVDRPVPTREDIIEAMKTLGECYKSDMSHEDYKKVMHEKGFDWTKGDLVAFDQKYGAPIMRGGLYKGINMMPGRYGEAMDAVINSICDDSVWDQKAYNMEFNITPEQTANEYLKWAVYTEKELGNLKAAYAKDNADLPFDYYVAYACPEVNTPPGVTCDEWWTAIKAEHGRIEDPHIPSAIEKNLPFRKSHEINFDLDLRIDLRAV